MATDKLYHKDAYLTDFEATVKDIAPLQDGRFAVVLDQTAFYPESGGQPSDRGYIGAIPVIDVQEQGDEVIHILEIPPAEKRITAQINWTRRFDHMQQHSGQHILSAAVYEITGAETVGFHLGAASSQIDIALNALTWEQIAAIEAAANTVVFANPTVLIHQATSNTLANFRIRKQPPNDVAVIRLIEFAGVDCCPCGGTHVATAGEIGLIKIRAWEKKKGLIRLDFVCGGRALRDYQLINQVASELSARFSAAIPELVQAVDKHFAHDAEIENRLHQMKQDYYTYLTRDLLGQAELCGRYRIIVHILSSALPQEVTELAKRLASHPATIALIAGVNPEQNKNHLTFACSTDVTLNMSEHLKAVLPLINGKGGGTAQSAQGGGSGVETTAEAVQAAKANIIKQL
ncbi:MAG: DHHA1 domain-containing protein [Negativicutes bacterium]|nr:DHHA1 domain-containing protein [Negativicutes bacterium]